MDFESQADVASRFRIGVHLVGKIIKEHTKYPEILRKRELKAERSHLEAEAISNVTNWLLQHDVPIIRSS